MITLHHLQQSRSFRIVWLLEELRTAYGLDYQLMTHARDATTFLAPSALKTIHPMGKAPILLDNRLPDGESLAESALIIEYLLKTYDSEQRFYPTAGKQWRDYVFWLHFAEGSLMPPLAMTLILTKAIQKSPFFIKPIAAKLKDSIERMILRGNITSALTLLESSLADQEWLAGEFSGADIQLHFAVAAAGQRAVDLADFPNIRAWLNRCEQRAAFRAAVARAGVPF